MAHRRGKTGGETGGEGGLGAAVERYRAAFGADALPCLAAVAAAAVPVAVALPDHAVAAGRPMPRGRVAAALGEEAAPTGGCLQERRPRPGHGGVAA